MVLGQLEDFKVKHGMGGMRVVIGAGVSVQEYLLTPVLVSMLRTNSDLRIDLRNLSSNECIEGVQNYALDLAISRPPTVKRGLQIHDVVSSRLRAVAAEEIADRVRDRTQLKQLATLPTVMLSGGGELTTSILNAFAKTGVSPNIVAEASSLVEVKKFVEAGVGISYLPEYCLTASDTLTSWELPGLSALKRHLVLYHLKDRTRDSRFSEFTRNLLLGLKMDPQ